MSDKPWVLTWRGLPCQIAKGCRLAQTRNVGNAAWFRDEDEFKVWIVSRFAERNFEGMYPWTQVRLVRKTWWRLWLWRKFDRRHSYTDSWFRRWDLRLFEFVERLVTG